MIPIDVNIDLKHTGNFLTLLGIADTHFLCDSDEENAYQPLDYEAYQYLKYCANEIKKNPSYYGKVITYTGGDLTELERSSTRKVMRALRKNDTRAQDTIHKRILNDDILPKIKTLTDNTQFIGGVAGNHMIEFSDDSNGTGYPNSEAYLIRRLGGQYCGEGKLLLNLHIKMGAQHCLKKVIITHGVKGGSKQSIIRELQQIFYQYGKIDLVIKCHAHDPMAHFHCRYDLPDTKTGKIKKVETLVMCLGSTRDGEKIGYDDYSERFNYSPMAARYPVAVFHAYKPAANDRTIAVKIRPLIM